MHINDKKQTEEPAEVIVKKFDPYWNNVKFVLITCVVIGHFCEAFFAHSRFLTATWEVIYVFHMPAFIMVSGIFLAKTINRVPFRIDRAVGYLLAYFFIFYSNSFEWNVFFHWGRSWQIFFENGIHWYMLAMAVYICVIHLLKDIKPAYVLSVSVLIALLLGYNANITDVFSASRITVAFPFFYLGYYLGKDRIKDFIVRLKSKRILIVLSLVYFVVLFILIRTFLEEYIRYISPLCTMRNSYFDLGGPLAIAWFLRLAFYGFTALTIIAFLLIIPQKHFRGITDIGRRTMQIYIGHGYICYLLMFLEYNVFLKSLIGSLWPIGLILSAIICVFLLSIKPLEKPCRCLLDLDLHFIYADKTMRK